MESRDNGLLERAQGCLLGQLAGDALGSMVEFSDAASIRQLYPGGLHAIAPSPVWHTLAGQPTDDSEMALALAQTLVEHGFDDEAVIDAYCHWYESGPFDIGGTVSQALSAAVDAPQGRRATAARQAANRTSKANGALMRQSPLSIWGYALPESRLETAIRADTTLTHPNQTCQDASVAYGLALAAILREDLTAEQAHERALAWSRQYSQSSEVIAALERAASAPPQYQPHEGFVLIALQNAFYQALHARSLEDGVVATVMGGGDTDTNAAIAGALLGALYGAQQIPDQWRLVILSCRPARGIPGVVRPRPLTYWPVAALSLAEQLVLRGAAG